MKKFYCIGKIVYLHNNHSSLTAKILLRDVGIAGEFDKVCQALEQDQDMLDFCIDFLDVAIESEAPDCGFTGNESVEKAIDDLDEFFVDMFGDEDYDYYALPNGRSAPYGLTGVEVAAMKSSEKVYFASPLYANGVCEISKGDARTKSLLVAVDRDLIFATREKAVEAYNALFGDLYGTV